MTTAADPVPEWLAAWREGRAPQAVTWSEQPPNACTSAHRAPSRRNLPQGRLANDVSPNAPTVAVRG
jgi:hypothetical protein